MPIRPRLTIDRACYHITTRGNQRQSVFRMEADYVKYIEFLRRYKRKYGFKLYGYCLMPNHVHLIGEIEEKMKLSKFMHGLNRSYTLYFNSKYRKVGHLWQGRFRSRVLNKDEYLINCINYVELNFLSTFNKCAKDIIRYRFVFI